MRALSSVLLLAGLLSAGCVSTSVRQPQAALPPVFEADAAAAQGAAGPGAAWWRAFQDRALADLVDQALVSSPDARSALAVLQEAQAARSAALAGFRPQGAPQAQASRSGAQLGDLDARADTASLNISWELDFLNRRRATKAGADANLRQATYDYQASRLALSAAVAQAYVDAQRLQRQVAEAVETARVAEELAKLGTLKAQRQVLSRSDAASLLSDAASARASLVYLRSQEQAARRGLLVLVGRGADPRDSLAIAATSPIAPGLPAVLPSDLLTRRPDLLAAAEKVKAASSANVMAKLAMLPSLSLAPGLSYSGPPGASLWTIAANATTPLLDLPRLRSQAAVTGARGEQAVLAYEKAVQVAYGESDRALSQLVADRSRLGDLLEAETQAKAAFDGQNLAFRAGYADLPSLLLAERLWRTARVNRTDVQAAVLSDTITAIKALGGGWTSAAPLAASNAQRPHR